MKLFKLKINKYVSISVKFSILLISTISMKSTLLNAEESYLMDTEINDSTKLDTSSSDLPSNPFEIMDMLRRANSMNEATKPSIAIDDALKLFNKIEEEENL